MNWQNYVTLAKRTEAIPSLELMTKSEQCTNPNSNTRAIRLMHAVAGLVTETQELVESVNDRNTAEELGDCFWYLALAFDELEMTLPLYSSPSSYNNYLMGMQHHAAELVDSVIKRHIFYGKELDVGKVKLSLESYAGCLMSYTLACNQYALSEILKANIKKLEKRYPKLRFNGDDAINRDVENELSHINDTAGPSKWEELKAGILVDYETADVMGLSFQASPNIIEACVLNHLQVESKDLALQLLGDELRFCQFTVVHKEWGIEVRAVPFDLGPPTSMTTEEFNHNYLQTPKPPEAVHPDEELSHQIKESPTSELCEAKNFNNFLRPFSSAVLEKLAMDITFEVATYYRDKGALELARAFDALYRTYSGKGDRLEDTSLYEMYKLLAPNETTMDEAIAWLSKRLRGRV